MNKSVPSSVNQENDINERAWLLWNKATQIADEIWDAFEQYFMDKIINEDLYPDNNKTI